VAQRRAKAEATRDTLMAYRIAALHRHALSKRGLPPLRRLLPDMPSPRVAPQTPDQMMRVLRLIAAQHGLPFPAKES
jgi:hypothetical protein